MWVCMQKRESEQGTVWAASLDLKSFMPGFVFSSILAIPVILSALLHVNELSSTCVLCLHLSLDNIVWHPVSLKYHILHHQSGILKVPSGFSWISLGWYNIKFYYAFLLHFFPLTLIRSLSLVDQDNFY